MEALLQSHETRLVRVEEPLVGINERLARLETSLDQFQSEVRVNMATKTEIKDMENRLVKWLVGTFIGWALASTTVLTFVLDNAIPKQGPVPQIVFQVPAVAAPARP